MKRRRFRSFAKINLGLEVVRRRDDGYHELKTLFAALSLHDIVGIEESGRGITIRSDHPDVPADETNLAYRAAEALQRIARTRGGLLITIEKRLAVGGGLGGGSSNAATVLRALDLIWDLRLGPAGLLEVARPLGADVPYFLIGGPALGLGRGDEIHPLPLKLPRRVLLVPGTGGVGTAAVFRRLRALGGPRRAPSRIDAFLRRLHGGPEDRPPSLRGLRNDLEPAALAEREELAEVARRVRRAGRASRAAMAAMSGSGSSFFLILENVEAERRASRALLADGLASVPCRFLSRRAYRSGFEISPDRA